MSKSTIFYNLGQANIANCDPLSAGVNFYYSLYHSCVSVISSVSKEIPVDQCVAEWGKKEQLPRFYIPLTHTETKKLIGQLDSELAQELDKLMKIREYLSYGPNILYTLDEKGEFSQIRAYTCKYPNLSREISEMRSRLLSLINRCCELLEQKLGQRISCIFSSISMQRQT